MIKWTAGFLFMLPITALTSCQVAFVMCGEIKTGLLVWFAESALFGLALVPIFRDERTL